MYKKKLRGFTLAEVLVSLAIVGVVAAMTLPTMYTNTKYAKIGPSLARMVNVLENANKLILMDNSTKSLGVACGTTGEDYINCLKSYVPGSVYAGTKTDTSGTFYLTNDGMTLYVRNTVSNAIGAESPYIGKYYHAFVIFKPDFTSSVSKMFDTDAKQGENVFSFYIDYNGSVIPVGGYAYDGYTGRTDTANKPVWEYDCVKGKIAQENDVCSCTGSIADNGWKVVYH